MKTSPIVGLTLNYRDPIRTVDCVVSILNDDIKHVLIWDNSEDGGLSSNQVAQPFSVQPAYHHY